jgi:LPXTG-motif cell wall-anchored protein
VLHPGSGAPLRLAGAAVVAGHDQVTDTDRVDDFGGGAALVKAATSASASPSVTATAAGDDGGSGGGLPLTGANTALLAGLGVLLLAGGLVAYLFARRRRTSFTA